MGLWMTINLEQYDNLDGFGGEAGVKVSMLRQLIAS